MVNYIFFILRNYFTMPTKFLLLLNSNANGKRILILLIIYAIFPLLLFPLSNKLQHEHSGSSAPPLDLEFAFSPQKAYEYVESYGETGRKLYAISALTIDIAYPIIYSTLFALIILFFLKRTYQSNTKLKKIALMPFAAAGADFFENSGIAIMLLTYPSSSHTLSLLTSVANTLKWLLVAATILSIFTLLLIWLYNFLFKN